MWSAWWTKRAVALVIAVVVVSSVKPFLKHWSFHRNEWEEAAFVLKSELCMQSGALGKSGTYTGICGKASGDMFLYPFFSALIETARDWYLCKGSGCALMMASVYEHLWSLGLLVVCIWALFMYQFGAQRSNQYVNSMGLPMHACQHPRVRMIEE